MTINRRDDDKGVAIMSRHRYPTEICRVFERTSALKLHAVLTSQEPDDGEPLKAHKGTTEESNTSKEKHDNRKGGKSAESKKSVGDITRTKQATLKNVLGEALGYGPALSEHIILDAGLVPNTKVSKDGKLDDDKIQMLVQAIEKFEDWLEDIISGERIPEGYILMQKKNLVKEHTLSEPDGSIQVIIIFLNVSLFHVP